MSYIDTNPLQHSNILTLFADRDQIIMDPTYQRQGEIWSKEKRQLLIDSILNRYDIPKLYFHKLDRQAIKSSNKMYAVVDGRQRLEAIFDFMDGKYELADDFEYLLDETVDMRGLNANDIAKKYPRIKQRFDAFNLPVVCVETDDLELIEEMFSRLNEAVPLNAAEKRNAIGGEMARTVTEVSKNSFFTKKVKFKNTRYQHKEGAVRLLFLEKCFDEGKVVDTKKPFLDAFVREHRAGKSTKVARLKTAVASTLKEMSQVFVDNDNLLIAQSSIPVYFLLFREAITEGKLNKLSRSIFIKFNEARQKNREIASEDITKAQFEFLEYDRLSQQGTNDASSIKERLNILRNFCGV
ncbi:MAG: DUF262 domain-containing protein [Verrucomicrobia bacterium]|nr:DUF262 domain-containing protein [Verrucomicrobiota bacterium]